jgi:hypothetical protein
MAQAYQWIYHFVGLPISSDVTVWDSNGAAVGTGTTDEFGALDIQLTAGRYFANNAAGTKAVEPVAVWATSSGSLSSQGSVTRTEVAINVKDYGATGNGTTDDTAAIQAAITAAKAATPQKSAVYFPRGSYRTTLSLNATGFGSIAPSFYGDGVGASQISAILTEAYPVIDFTGTGRAHIHDLWIHGGSAGLQTCATLNARQITTNAGDGAKIDNFFADGTYSQVGMAFISADLSSVRDSGCSGPSAIVSEVTDVLGVGSKFATFASVTGNTIFRLDNVAMGATARAGIVYGGGSTLSIKDSYCNMSGGATAAIELVGSGGRKIFADNFRAESNSSTTDTCLLSIPAGVASNGGTLIGEWTFNNNGSIVRFGDSSSAIQNYVIRGSASFTGTGTPKFFSGTGNHRNCQIWNTYPSVLITDIGATCWNNIVTHQSSSASWAYSTYSAGYVNIQLNETSQSGLGVVSPDVQTFTATGTWTKPTNAKTVKVLLISPGGGGGSGRRGAAGTVRCGGGGGSGGMVIQREFDATDLSSTVTVGVPVGGSGGAAITVDDTNGASPSNPSGSGFGAYLLASAGLFGSGGTATNGIAGSAFSGGGPSTAGAGASASTTGGNGVGSLPGLFGAAGAPSGGGITSANVAGTGANGNGSYTGLYAAGGAGGTVDTTAPAAGTGANSKGSPGGSSGSGAASITTTAQSGANAGATCYGAGGSGGGASLNGNASGAGGAGGSGYALVITYFQ